MDQDKNGDGHLRTHASVHAGRSRRGQRRPLDGAPSRGPISTATSVALDADADPGWTFSGWSGDLGGNSTGETVTIDGSKVVTATFTQNVYTVNAASNGGGSVVLSPQLPDYRYGDVVAVEAVPDPGYAFQSWSGVTGDGRGLILVVDSNKSFTANFGPASYTISTTVSGGGAITLNPNKDTYAYGEVVQVTATPDAEWAFAEWGLGLSGNTAEQPLTVTDDTNLQAIFAPKTYGLNVAWIGNGTAQKLTDKTAFTAGEVVSVAATPGVNGVDFAGWRNEESDTFFSTELTTTVTITGDRSVVAIFGVPLYPVTANVVGSGTVTPTVSAYALGETATLTATAASGWSFTEWSGDVTGATNPITLTVDASKVVTATFIEDVVTPVYTLTVNVVGSGTVTPTGGAYTGGVTVPITATADAGWTFSGWSGDFSGTTNPATLTMDASKAITATFVEDVVIPDYTLTVNVVGNGTVTPTGGTYAEGTVVQMSATANAGWAFTGWSGDLTDTASSVNVTMDGNKTLTATFVNTPPTEAELTGNFLFQSWAGPNYHVPLAVNLYPVGSTVAGYQFAPMATGTDSGQFTISDITPGAYQVAVKHDNHLQVVATIALDAGANVHDFGVLPGGDANGDNRVNFIDFSILTNVWKSQSSDGDFDVRADFDGDGKIFTADFALLSANWETKGQAPTGP